MRRKRGEYSKWANDSAVTDACRALALLEPHQQGRYSDKRFICPNRQPPELWVDWHREADSGGDGGGVEYFEIDPAVLKQLVDERWVTPNVRKYYGGSTVELDKLVISELGSLKLRKHYAEQCDAARKLVVPGEHTKFSGVLNLREQRYEGVYGDGPLCFELVTPMNEGLRVYPQTGRVEKLDP